MVWWAVRGALAMWPGGRSSMTATVLALSIAGAGCSAPETVAGGQPDRGVEEASSTVGAESTLPTSITDPAILAERIDVPGDPVSVEFAPIPMGIVNDDARSIPGPTDYVNFAVIEYRTPEEAAAAAGPETGSGDILVADWYPAELIDLSHEGEWDRRWLPVIDHTPESGWVDWVGVVEEAPRYIVVEYAPMTT